MMMCQLQGHPGLDREAVTESTHFQSRDRERIVRKTWQFYDTALGDTNENHITVPSS